MDLTGFKSGEIDALLAPPMNQHKEPIVPDQHGPAVTKLGDVWAMGAHRLICGDSTKPVTYEALMDGRQASCIFTDPPYGVSYEASSGKFGIIDGDDLRRGHLTKMLHGAFSAAIEHTNQDAGWYVWHASATREDFARAMRDVGLVELAYLIWAKPGHVLGWSDYRWAHEPCFYAARQGISPAFYGDRTQSTVWRLTGRKTNGEPHTNVGSGLIVATASGQEIYIAATAPKGKKVRHLQLNEGEPVLLGTADDADDLWEVSRDGGGEETIHPTQKPVELARRAVKNSSRENEIVLDFFAGSGSTLIACEQLTRACYAIELDPRYCDAIVKRWETLTGKKATHAHEKKTHQAIAKERAKEEAGAT